MAPRQTRRGEWSWMLFDWANQPFYTLVITFIFGPYFAASVVGDPVAGQALWAQMNLWAGLLVAFMAPVLGAVADASGARKPWIAAFSALFMVGSIGLWIAEPGADPLWPVLLFFTIAFIGSEFSLVFTNAMLPDLGPREEIGRISGSGWAMGYVGGVLSLLIVLVLLAPAGGGDRTLAGLMPLFGLDPAAGEPARAVGPLTALWFGIFALPLFLFTPDAPRRAGLRQATHEGIAILRGTIGRLRQAPGLLRYLIASMVYRDGLAGLFAFGGIYAAGTLDWGVTELGIFGIVAAITGAAGAFAGGRADRRFGPRPVIVASIWLLILVAAVALMTSREAVLGIAMDERSRIPDAVFLAAGGLLGAAAGSLQAASRTLLVHFAEGGLPMTEAFGLYALSGKATAFLSPLLIGIATTATGSQALGVSPVIALFALGLVLLYWAQTPQEARA